jgi:ankyrin repeat protein
MKNKIKNEIKLYLATKHYDYNNKDPFYLFNLLLESDNYNFIKYFINNNKWFIDYIDIKYVLAGGRFTNIKIINFLIKSGMNIHKLTQVKENILFTIIDWRWRLNNTDYELFKFLIKKGIDINQVNIKGLNVLHYFIAYRINIKYINFLLKKNIVIKNFNKAFNFDLFYSSQYENDKIILQNIIMDNYKLNIKPHIQKFNIRNIYII